MVSRVTADTGKASSVTGDSWKGKIPIEDKARAQRYNELTKDVHIDTEKTSYQRQELKEAQKELKKDWDLDELEKLDELKRQFVEAMFKKD